MLCLLQIHHIKVQCGGFHAVHGSDRHSSLLPLSCHSETFDSRHRSGILGIQIRIEHLGYSCIIDSGSCKILSVPHSLYRAVSIPGYIFITCRKFHHRTDTDKSCQSCILACIHARFHRNCAASIYRIDHLLTQIFIVRIKSDCNFRLSFLIFPFLDFGCSCNPDIHPSPVISAFVHIIIGLCSPVVRHRTFCHKNFIFPCIIPNGSCRTVDLKAEILTGYDKRF